MSELTALYKLLRDYDTWCRLAAPNLYMNGSYGQMLQTRLRQFLGETPYYVKQRDVEFANSVTQPLDTERGCVNEAEPIAKMDSQSLQDRAV